MVIELAFKLIKNCDIFAKMAGTKMAQVPTQKGVATGNRGAKSLNMGVNPFFSEGGMV